MYSFPGVEVVAKYYRAVVVQLLQCNLPVILGNAVARGGKNLHRVDV